MSISEITHASQLHGWRPSRPELHEPCIHVKALGQEKKLPFDCWTACFRCSVEAS